MAQARSRDDGSSGQRSPSGQEYQRYDNSGLLLQGEEVLVDARPAWSAWTGTLVLAAVVMIGALLTGESTVLAVGLIFGIALVGFVWYQRRKVRYVVTDSRVIVVTGITSRQTNEAWHEDVKGLQTGASFLERFLGHGHIMVSREILPSGSFLLAGLRGQGMKLGGIGNHQQIAQVIRQRQAERKR